MSENLSTAQEVEDYILAERDREVDIGSINSAENTEKTNTGQGVDSDKNKDINDEEGKGSNSYQKRINEITRARREAERETQEARREAEYYKEMAMGGQRNVQSGTVHGGDSINVNDYDNYDDYVSALVANRASAIVDERLRGLDEEDAHVAAQERHDEVIAGWQDREAKVAATHSDYIDVVGSSEIQISEIMAHAMLESEKGPEIAYYLAKNPDMADKIYSMSPVSAARAIGRIEVELENTEARVTRAPAPLKQLRGGGGTVSKNPENMSFKEYKAYRQSGGT